MAEELTGLDLDAGIDTPNESLADAASSEDTDTALAKQLNVDRLPDTPEELKALALKRTRELRDMGRKSGETAKEYRSRIETLEKQFETFMKLAGPKEAPAQSGPPHGASDEEILDYYIDQRMEKKYGSKFSTIDRLVELQAKAMEERARQQYGEDFDQHEDEIVDALKRFPGMTLDEAVRYAASGSADKRARRDVLAEQEARLDSKRGAGTLAPGTPSSGLREPDVSTTDSHNYFQWAAREAMREHFGKSGLPVEA